MSEWLDIMLDEIASKRRELDAAKEEAARRAEKDGHEPAPAPKQKT